MCGGDNSDNHSACHVHDAVQDLTKFVKEIGDQMDSTAIADSVHELTEMLANVGQSLVDQTRVHKDMLEELRGIARAMVPR